MASDYSENIIRTCGTNMLSLTRKQVLQLAEIANKFPDANWFGLTENSGSGIGPTVHVTLSVFTDDDTKINITDVSTW